MSSANTSGISTNSTNTNSENELAAVAKQMSIINDFLDGGSFVELEANSGFGVVTGYGATEGRLVYVYCQYDFVNQNHASKIERLYAHALKMGAPVVGILDSNGMELKNGMETLGAYGDIFKCMSECSGVVPQISVVLGKCIGTASFIPALSDIVIMLEKAQYFLESPAVLKDKVSMLTSLEKAGSGSFHKTTGLAHLVVKDESEASALLKELLPYLPSNNLDEAPIGMFVDDLNRVDNSLTGDSDIKSIISTVADNNQFLELKPEYEKNVLTGFARFNGYSVGIVANSGALTPASLSKAGAFVSFCDAFSIPLVSFASASDYEGYDFSAQRDVILNAAKLINSFAQATVPKINVLCGKSGGSPYLMFNSKNIGADIAYAWDTAKISVIDSVAAEKITGLSVDDSPKAITIPGFIDNIIEPSQTRKMVIAALEMLNSKRVLKYAKKRSSFMA